MLTRDDYLTNLLDQVPEFRPIYEAHLAENEEVLHHVLMGELFVFALQAYERLEIVLLARIVNLINQAALSGDKDLREVVHASFIEEVPYSPLNDAVRPLLNDAAAKMYQAVVGHRVAP